MNIKFVLSLLVLILIGFGVFYITNQTNTEMGDVLETQTEAKDSTSESFEEEEPEEVVVTEEIKREVIETGYIDGYTYITQPDGSVINDKFVFESPDGIKFEIPNEIADGFTNFDGERLSAGIFPLKPDEEQIIYISTTENVDSNPEDEKYERINRIYEFNLVDFNLSEKVELADSDDKALRIIGMEDNQIIVHPAYLELSGGPCSNNWADFTDDLFSINTANFNSGLIQYTPPEKMVQDGIKWQEECIASL